MSSLRPLWIVNDAYGSIEEVDRTLMSATAAITKNHFPLVEKREGIYQPKHSMR